MTVTVAPAPGWYDDPTEAGWLRWWDGQGWTSHRARPSAAPAPTDVRAVGEGPPVSVALALAMTFGPLAVTIALTAVLDAGGLSYWWVVGTGVFVVHPLATLVGPAWYARHHRRSLVAMTGLRFRWGDVPRGLALGAVSVIGVLSVFAALLAIDERLVGSDDGGEVDGLPGEPGVVALLAVFFVAAVVLAPLLEELTFRGVLLPAMSARWGPLVGWVGSALLFGSAHVQPTLGWGNVGIALGLSVPGLLLGYEARRAGRLGPPVVLHATHNAIVLATVVIVLVTES